MDDMESADDTGGGHGSTEIESHEDESLSTLIGKGDDKYWSSCISSQLRMNLPHQKEVYVDEDSDDDDDNDDSDDNSDDDSNEDEDEGYCDSVSKEDRKNEKDGKIDEYERLLDKLGEALLSNSYITVLSVNVASLLPQWARYSDDHASKFLLYLRTSTSLQHVILLEKWWEQQENQEHWSFISRVCQAIGENPNITKCTWNEIFPHALVQLLQTTRSLTELRLWNTNWLLLDQVGLSELAKPTLWAMNPNLVSLVLGFSDARVVGSILTGLSGHPSLRDLKLSTERQEADPDGSSAPTKWQPPTATLVAGYKKFVETAKTLQNIVFWNVRFNKDDLMAFLLPLVLNQTLTKLALHECCVDDDAVEYLIEHVQDEYNKLMLEFLLCSFRGTCSGSVYRRMLAGSSLQCLVLATSNENKARSWISGLKNDSTRLPVLELHSVSKAEMKDVADALPTLPHLEELSIQSVSSWGRNTTNNLLRAFRSNASLKQLVLPSQHATDEQKRRADAYGQRNIHVPKLLAASSNKETQQLVPSLVVSALPAERMTPKNVLLGLLSQRSTSDPSSGENAHDLKRKLDC